jgi:hypothetical protein
MDPAVQCDYASFLYGIGLIDLSAKAVFQAEQDKMIDLIGQKEWLKAFEVLVQIILFYFMFQKAAKIFRGSYEIQFNPQSKNLTRGPPELVQHFRL